MGVRAAGGVRGVRDGPARDWCRRAMVTHRVVAWVAASAALYACALMVASTRQRDALSPAGVTIATLVYVSFAVVLIVRWPSWLLAAVSTAGAVTSMAAGTRIFSSGPRWLRGCSFFSLRSEKTPAIAGTAAAIGVLLARMQELLASPGDVEDDDFASAVVY
jgi:MFS superfamily sulfate permease-like transporter